MSKSKTIHHDVSTEWRIQYWFDSSVSGPSSGDLSNIKVVSHWDNTVTTGDNFDDWKQRIKDGLQATTNMDGTITRLITLQEGKGYSDWRFSQIGAPQRWEKRQTQIGGVFVSSGSLTPSKPIPVSSKTAENVALARFNAKAAQVNRQFQGGVFFAELHKTLHGITHPAEALFKGIEGYSRAATKLRRSFVKDRATFRSLSRTRQRQVAKSFSKAATGLWLEQSFHWLPLMYDIQGAVSAFQALLDDWPSVFVKVSATDVQDRTDVQSEMSPGAGITLPYTETQSAGATVRMYGRVRVSPRVSSLPDMKALGLDVRSFVPTLWELVPYSWAIDYFTNIGDMIYGASYGGCDVLWASQGFKRWSRYDCQVGVSKRLMVAPQNFQNDLAVAFMKPSLVATEKAVIHRAPYTGNFIPFPEFRVPKVNSLKWLNLGAAFLQRSLAFL